MFDAHDDLDLLPASLATAMRRDVRPTAGRDAAVSAIMDAVRAAPAPSPRPVTFRGRFLSLKPMRPRWSLRRGALSPAGAVLATCLTLAVGWLGALGGQKGATVVRSRPGTVAGSRPAMLAAGAVIRDSLLDNALVLAIRDTMRVVRFALEAPAATSVALVGDFTGWTAGAVPLRLVAGAWTGEVPLRRGRHSFGFVVNDTGWIGTGRAARHALAVDSVAMAPSRVPGDTI